MCPRLGTDESVTAQRAASSAAIDSRSHANGITSSSAPWIARICGADANPYLAAAAILAGIRHGIRGRLDPGAPVTGNGYAQATEFLPTDWLTALRALEGSDWAREAFGTEFLKVYLAIKQVEYAQFMAEVGEQDWRWFLAHA